MGIGTDGPDLDEMAQERHERGFSDAALEIANLVDRLPDGEYTIELEIRPRRDGGVSANVSKKDRIRRVGSNGQERTASGSGGSGGG